MTMQEQRISNCGTEYQLLEFSNEVFQLILEYNSTIIREVER
jgi:hypothetical protein